jgi:hypothetical protein
MKLCSIPLAGLLATALAGPAMAADNCEALRADIEARIRAAGVVQPSVTVVAVDAAAPGRTVGSCDLGRKKIVYLAQDTPATAIPRPTTPVLTECRDGSTPVDGRCAN